MVTCKLLPMPGGKTGDEVRDSVTGKDTASAFCTSGMSLNSLHASFISYFQNMVTVNGSVERRTTWLLWF